MARSNAVWGIDIGQCAIKALRCTPGEGNTIVADKYDYIEYPKILSQPEADPEEMIREALQRFLSRNEVRGDSVAISVPGQAGLSRFFKPPPVEARTLPDIVKYEVKQQIPFPIEDVIWDWQQLGGSIIEGRTVDAEIGLFAMKREAVYKALRPFDDADIEVNLVQLSPLAIFNVVAHDILDDIPNPEDIDPENPPESIVVMSMGTDTTDLIVTNGIKLWLRNIPIGGNHFTKQLSRELKLTQTKAEHLKRNASKAEDPKSVFKAMRPVFNDLVNEVQRSLTFFQSMDKTASISRIVLLGNAGKLPGLRTFLNKQLDIDIAKVSEFENLTGPDVIKQKSFANNVLSLAPCYGLCLQGLKKGNLNTDLLPREIKTERIIRAKKPWILASVGALMLGLLLGYGYKQNAAWGVNPKFAKGEVTWADAHAAITQQQKKSADWVRQDREQKTKLEKLNQLNAELTSASENKATWIEILKAIYEAMPKDERLVDLDSVDPQEVAFEDRKEIYVDHMETRHFDDVSEWSESIKPIYDNQFTTQVSADSIDMLKGLEKEAKKTSETTINELDKTAGWVIELRCHHYHNSDESFNDGNWGKTYVIRTLVEKLIAGEIEFPGADDEVEGGGMYKFKDFGISYPTLVRVSSRREKETIPYGASGGKSNSRGGQNRDGDPGDRNGSMQGDEEDEGADTSGGSFGSDSDISKSDFPEGTIFLEAYRYDFTVQMAWVPRSPKERFEAREIRLQEEAKTAKADANKTKADN